MKVVGALVFVSMIVLVASRGGGRAAEAAVEKAVVVPEADIVVVDQVDQAVLANLCFCNIVLKLSRGENVYTIFPLFVELLIERMVLHCESMKI